MDFRIRQLQCFLVLAEKLNYSQAARSQFMTQPTLSFQIKSLEEDFGTRLFDRNHKGVQLTTAGRQLAISARRILAEVASVQREISGVSVQNPLRVCCSQAGQFEILPKVIRALAESDPHLPLQLEPMVPEERVKALTAGTLDVLMMVAPVQAPGVTFQLLRRETLIAAVPDTPLYRDRKSISIHEFARMPLLIARESECSYCKEFALATMRRFHLTPETIETPVNLNFQLSMVAAGSGLAIASESLLGLRFPSVLFLPFEETMHKIKLGVAWRSNDTSPALKLFHETLVKIAYRSPHEGSAARLPSLERIDQMAEEPALSPN